MQKIIIYTDGGSRGNPGVSGAGVHITDSTGATLQKASKPLGKMTNNEAEYHAVIFGLETVKKVIGKEKTKTTEDEIRLDSELVKKQLTGECQTKEEHLWPLFMKIWNLRVSEFNKLSFIHIPREQNSVADGLANEAMDGQGSTKTLF